MADKELNVTLPADLMAKVAAEAQTTDRPLAEVVKTALEMYLIEEQRARDFALEDDCRE